MLDNLSDQIGRIRCCNAEVDFKGEKVGHKCRYFSVSSVGKSYSHVLSQWHFVSDGSLCLVDLGWPQVGRISRYGLSNLHN